MSNAPLSSAFVCRRPWIRPQNPSPLSGVPSVQTKQMQKPAETPRPLWESSPRSSRLPEETL